MARLAQWKFLNKFETAACTFHFNIWCLMLLCISPTTPSPWEYLLVPPSTTKYLLVIPSTMNISWLHYVSGGRHTGNWEGCVADDNKPVRIVLSVFMCSTCIHLPVLVFLCYPIATSQAAPAHTTEYLLATATNTKYLLATQTTIEYLLAMFWILPRWKPSHFTLNLPQVIISMNLRLFTYSNSGEGTYGEQIDRKPRSVWCFCMDVSTQFWDVKLQVISFTYKYLNKEWICG